MWKSIALAAALAVAGGAAQAQSKKELVQKVLQLQQPGIDGVARNLAEQPAAQLVQRAEMVMRTQVAPEKREALVKDVQADIKKYMDDAVPVVRDAATKLAPTTMGALLEEKFSEDELKQLIAWLESPVNRKFQQTAPELNRALVEKVVTETKPSVEAKLKTLDAALVKRLQAAGATPQGASSPAAKK